MDNDNDKSTSNNNNNNKPTLCIAGCGFFGNPAFCNMCSQCFKAKHNKKEPSSSPKQSKDDTTVISAIEKTRKHLRSPSPEDIRASSAPTSSIASPAPVTETETATNNNEKAIQLNKGRCFKCRSKVPLAKQAANKCRCGYVFCDSHRYPDRHDCDIDYAKLDREILAKNNPKLHERPKGGRSFQRIDSL